MKVADFKLELPKGGTLVVNIEELKNSGRRNNNIVNFGVGDKIQFPEDVNDLVSYWAEFRGNKSFHVQVLFNGKARFIPIGVIRRTPIDHEEAFSGYPVNMELAQNDHDFDLINSLFGKTLTVTEMREFDFRRYDKDGALMYDDEGRIKPVKRRIPIFAM